MERRCGALAAAWRSHVRVADRLCERRELAARSVRCAAARERLDAGNHTKAAAAAPARLDLDGEYPLEALRPRQGPLPIGDGGFAALTGHGGARSGLHPGPIRARRCEHAVVADLMLTGLRHECGKSRDEILGLENDVSSPIAIRRLQCTAHIPAL